MTAASPNPEAGKPEDGISIARAGEAASLLRHRLERPAQIGRTLLIFIGAVTAAAGIADWVTTRSSFGIVIGVFGAILLAFGVLQHWLHKRDIAHWPTDVLLWQDGVELVLSNGEVRGLMWSDPDLAIQLIARKAPAPANREFILLWLTDSKVPVVEISEEGFELLSKTAFGKGLQIAMTRRGPRVNGTQMIQIRQRPADVPRPGSSNPESNGGA